MPTPNNDLQQPSTLPHVTHHIYMKDMTGKEVLVGSAFKHSDGISLEINEIHLPNGFQLIHFIAECRPK